MGIEVALMAIAIGSAVGKGAAEYEAASEKEHALDLQAKEMKLMTSQKTLANYDTMEKVIAAQTAHMTTTGAAFSSPSFNAIQRNTLNIGAKKQRNTDIEGELQQENIDIEKQNVKSTLYAQIFGDVSQAASSAAGIYNKMPTMED